MGNAINYALVFVCCLNVFLWLGQLSMDNINPGGNVTSSFKCTGTMLQDYGDCASFNLNDASTQLGNTPSADATVFGTISNFFVDIFNSIKSWFLNLAGVNWFVNMLSAPYHVLIAMNVPAEFAFALGGLWYGITFFLIIAFWWGRE